MNIEETTNFTSPTGKTTRIKSIIFPYHDTTKLTEEIEGDVFHLLKEIKTHAGNQGIEEILSSIPWGTTEKIMQKVWAATLREGTEEG